MKPQPLGEVDWRRRHALTLASELPEDHADALVILDLMRELVVNFLQAGAPEPVKALVRLPLRASRSAYPAVGVSQRLHMTSSQR
jgi:hypothetical protein